MNLRGCDMYAKLLRALVEIYFAKNFRWADVNGYAKMNCSTRAAIVVAKQ